MQEIAAEQLQQTMALLGNIAKNIELHGVLVVAAKETAESMKSDHKLMVVGNGGSAADAQHFVAEFVSRLITGANEAMVRLCNYCCAFRRI